MGAMIFISDSLSLTVAQVWAQPELKGDIHIQQQIKTRQYCNDYQTLQ